MVPFQQPSQITQKAYCHWEVQAVRFKPRVIQEAPAGHNSGLGHAADQQVALACVSRTFQTCCLDAAVRATRSRPDSWH
jgi:hypothetical protein